MASRLFRCIVGTENRRLPRMFYWAGILKINSGTPCLLVMRGRAQLTRVVSLIVSSLAISAVGILVSIRFLDSYLMASLNGWEYDFSSFSSALILFFVLITFGTIGLMYLLDFLTLSLQSRFAWETAILRVKDVHPGRLQQVLDVVVEKDLAPIKIPGEFVMTVAATRRGLNSALASKGSTVITQS